MSTYYILGTIVDSWNAVVNKTETAPQPQKLQMKAGNGHRVLLRMKNLMGLSELNHH